MRELDFLILGAQKSGTTSLRAFLRDQCSDIYAAKKELHFWDRQSRYKSGEGVRDYLGNFSDARESQIIGEKTPSYLFSKDAPFRIHEHFPKIKLLVILRNPVNRAYSAYWHGRRIGAIPNSMTFGEIIRGGQAKKSRAFGDVVKIGFYSNQIENYLEYFPEEQVHCISFEESLKNNTSELKDLLSFLLPNNSELTGNKTLEMPIKNEAREVKLSLKSRIKLKKRSLTNAEKSQIRKESLVHFKVPSMDECDRKYLVDLYSGEAPKLFSLVGKKFDWNN